MTIKYFLAWFAVMFPLVFSPGPANIVFAMSGARQGMRRSLPFLVGVNSVYILCSLVAGFGLGGFVQRYEELMLVVKLVGIAYIFYLAYKFSKPKTSTNTSTPRSIYSFYDGAVLQLFNPKGWTLMFLMFSLFLTNKESPTEQILLLVMLLAVLNIITHVVWIGAGSAMSIWMSSSRSQQYMNWFFSLSLLLVALWLLFEVFVTR